MRDTSAVSPLLRQGFVAISIAAAAVLLLGANDAPAQEYFRLQVKQTGKFLDAVNCSDNVALHPGSDYANGACQLWRFVPAGGGWNRLQLKQNGKYLDAVNCTDRVALNPGSDHASGGCQLWRFVSAGDGWSRLQLKQNLKYLDAVNCSDVVALHPGSDYANGACQVWRFVRPQAADNRPPSGPAPPAPTSVQKVDEDCGNYASAAVRQFKLTQSRRECAIRPDARWQGNYDAHYSWCLRAPLDARGAEQAARDEWLLRCGAAFRY
jgi:hypothetical protein